MRCRGFTLVELVITLVVLAILALGVTSYLGIGSRMYADAALREQVLGQSRFVAERLVRELRNAVPNSVSFSLSSNCLQFRPILYSGVYTSLPFEQNGTSMTVISPSLASVSPVTYASGSKPQLLVYPTAVANPGGTVVLNSISTENAAAARFTLNFDSFRFTRQSPERRFYIADERVNYCIVSAGSGRFNMERRYAGNRVLMAEGLTSDQVFRVTEPVLTRNAVVNILLRFGYDDSADMFLNYEVHIPNVP
ncbi:prepilin-type N-terminal cleavage/methylation domain-containing protein [Rheinheimera aquimaris]|uniref:Prepilin-type N-terminal cleavage/methylation domain-containing protein n=1 Tax=Rheinheimera aquimaris TaxID=412437 RepID=A0ABN1E7I4_9GAMM|nr:prepilin-type N-terminal cleavage/methylation domain-containing protein [Rheinheimera aquimaris]MCB5215178.1 prepilin-type N-terminal cleavage/methylation domain-containing protein [Rheinheimera aquimaris]